MSLLLFDIFLHSRGFITQVEEVKKRQTSQGREKSYDSVQLIICYQIWGHPPNDGLVKIDYFPPKVSTKFVYFLRKI